MAISDTPSTIEREVDGSAIEYFSTSIEQAPDNPHWHLRLARAYEQRGEQDLARQARERGRRLLENEGVARSAVALP